MSAVMQTIYAPAKLLVTIVDRGRGEAAMTVAKGAGARGGTILLGRGTADNRLLHLLGLDDVGKDVLLTLTAREAAGPVMEALRSAGHLRKSHGIVFRIDVGGMLRHVPWMSSEPEAEAGGRDVPSGVSTPHPEVGSDIMSESATHELISVIVNAGYADDIMAAARKAGAPGGTVINARGTGREDDVKFFGITIVPEKELILILVHKEQSPTILNAVKSVPCLAQPGIGIAFCMDVESFATLGG